MKTPSATATCGSSTKAARTTCFAADRFVAIEVPAAVRASLLKAAQG